MQQARKLVWKGLEYGSKEHCSIAVAGDEILINSTIRSRPVDIDLNISYSIRLNADWETSAVRVAGRFANKAFDYDFQRHGPIWTNWDGTQLSGALEPDISFTPLTNTLPIRRLKLPVGESVDIEVLYFDLAERRVGIRKERYTRLSELAYRFETVPKDFEAVIEVDEQGFVTKYPGLFSRA